MSNILGQVLGYSGLLCCVLAFLSKSRSKIVAISLVAKLFFVAHFIVLGAFSGAIQNGIGGIACLIAYFRGRKPLDSKYVPIFILALTLFGGAITYDSTKGIVCILPVMAMVLQNLGCWMNNKTHIRIMTLVSVPMWFIYNYVMGSVPAMISDTMSGLSLIYALTFYDIIPCIKRNRK